LDGRNRYAILYRIHEAKKPETRARRIEKFVDMLARGETIYPMRGRRGDDGPDAERGGRAEDGVQGS
jgi:hypothetical protein